MIKNIEVELRSIISKEKYEELLKFFKQNSKFFGEDYQETYYFDFESNFRIQRNNSGAKIWYKNGKVHDDIREEVEIHINKNDFDRLERLLGKIGHSVKIKWFRKRNQFDWNGIIISLDYTKGYGYIIEMELMSSEDDKEKNLQILKQKFSELNIPITPKEEFKKKYEEYIENWEELTR